jgi:phenylacetic acid degradation operon negative regulatory protein
MDKNRKTSEKNKKVWGVAKTILAMLTEAGEITLKSFFAHPYSHAFCKHGSRKTVYSSFSQLKKKGWIKKQSGDTFRLTKAGEKEAFFAHLDAQAVLYHPKKQKWDGFWRMVVFDIPEKKRRYRDYLRQMLKTLDFRELQKSTWVTPYLIPDFLKELLWEERVKHFTRFITIKEIDYDKDLKKIFKLS